MSEYRDRIRLVRHIQHFPNVNGVMQDEFLALQGRFLCELIARAIVSFAEIRSGEIKKSRKPYRPKSIVATIPNAAAWPKEVCWSKHRAWNGNGDVPNFHLKKIPRIRNIDELDGIHGAFGDILHSQHRPRLQSPNRLDSSQISTNIERLDLHMRMHILEDELGFGLAANLEPKSGEVLVVPLKH